MATTVNDRDVLIASQTRTQAVTLPPDVGVSGDVTGTLNGIPVQDVIDAANSGGGGDMTQEILENSGTTILMTSSNLFKTTTGIGGVFIGGGGIFGKNTSGVTTFSINGANGDATFKGTLEAGSIITSSITLTGSGRTLAMIDAGATGYNAAALQADLNTGVGKILAGVGSNYRLNVDTTNAFVTLQHKDAIYNGVAAAGSNKPAIGISSAGIAMGYNRSSDGQWVNAVAIDATGNATFAGTISASSVIAQDVLVSGTSVSMIDLVNGMGGSTFDLQGALDAGVTNILAGVGSNYRMDVNTASGYAVFRHKDAVYNGTAAAGSVKPALGISAAGIAMGYNRASDGAWVNAVAIDATGNATFAGTVAANSIIANTATVNGVTLGTIQNNAATGSNHAALTGNVHNVSLTQISGDLDDIANGSTYFKTTSTQVAGATRAANALDSSSDYIRSLVSTKMALVGANPSTGIVMDGNGIRMYQSSSLRVNIPVSGDPSFSGNITGGSNITITGTGTFNGSTSASIGATALVANASDNAVNGVYGRSTGTRVGVAGFNSGTGSGLSGSSTGGGDGVFGLSSGGSGAGGTFTGIGTGSAGVRAIKGSGAGNALEVQGSMSITSTALVTNLNADRLDSQHGTAFCRTIGSHSGTATVSSSHFNILTTVSGVTTSGGGSNITIAPSSDERLKQDIIPEPLGLDFINALNPVEYRLKANPAMKYHGFIAQDVAPLISATDDCLYQTNPDGMLGVDYIAIIAPLVNAVKELKQRIEILEAQQP